MTELRSPAPQGGRFRTTRWSLVLAAGHDDDRSASALTGLCEAYWYPVYGFIRRQGYDSDAAKDLTQGFFARVIEKGYFREADPARGRFRAFLSASIRHFLSHERERARALKRGGPLPPLSIDFSTEDGDWQIDPPHDLTPERVFDHQWAMVLLSRVLARVGQAQAAAGRGRQFEHLKGFVTGENEGISYGAIGEILGMTEGAVKVAVHRLRRQFRDTLMEEIAETVSEPSEIDAELNYLLQVVSVTT